MSYKFGLVLFFITLLFGCHRSEHQYQGYIESDTIYLSEPFSGILKHRYVHRGEYVKQGQLLFEIDPEPELFKLSQAKATVAQGEQTLRDLEQPRRPPEIDAIKAQLMQVDAEIALATLRLKRNQTLFNKKVIAPDTLDASQEYLKERLAVKMQMEANLALAMLGARTNQIAAQKEANKALEAERELAQWSVAQKKLTAPKAGFIFDVYYGEGEFVTAASPVAALLSREDIYLEFFVPLRDLHDLKLGKAITYYYLQHSEARQAQIVYVSPKAEYMPPLVYSNDNFDKLVYRVKAKLLDANDVFPGEPVTIQVEHSND
jgi:HlyD family secretion protein